MRTLSALVLTALLALPALAQPPGGGRGRGMMGGGAAMLLGIEDVQKDLKITDEQKEKIKTFQTKQREALQGLFGGGGERPDREKMAEIMKKTQDETKAFMKEALTEEQNKRLNQISLQNSLKTMPAMAFANEDTAKALKITDEQKEKIKAVSEQMGKDMAELRPERGQQPSADAQKKMEALRKEANEKIMEALTEDQHKTLKELQGKTFEGKIELPGGGRPRRPAGNRNSA